MSKNKKNKKKLSGNMIFGLSISIFVIIVILVMMIFKDDLVKEDKTNFTGDTVYDISLENQPVMGSNDAPVTLVAYVDYKCPACGAFESTIFPQLKADFIDTGKVKFVVKNYPFIFQDSFRAAVFAEGILDKFGSEAFYEFHEKIYAYQNEIYPNGNLDNEGVDKYTEKYLMSVAKDMFGDDADKMTGVLEDEKYTDAVQEDLNEGKKVAVSGTPSVYVNGRKVFTGLDYSVVKGAIEEASTHGDQK